VGKTSSVRDNYNGVLADFADAGGRKLTIEVRAFDDGVAFRYVVPDQPALKQVRIANELTEFAYVKDATTYPLILDGNQSSYEDTYQLREVSGLHPDWLIGLPLLAEEPGLGWVAITEANIDNFAGMCARKNSFSPMALKRICHRWQIKPALFSRALPLRLQRRSTVRGGC
jgi:alpha-glucosidase